MSVTELGVSRAPEKGQLVLVRDRHWVASDVAVSTLPVDELAERRTDPQHLVTLISVEDDGSADEMKVVWEVEPGAAVLESATLPEPQIGRFDEPLKLAAFLDAVRWGAVTSADPRALQAPFRSGIEIEDYQLDPVVRALRMPRVNLLVADDVGLGKTIEAGLVIQELLLRHRARTVMVVCPASLCLKWRSEMMEKFGLEFQIVDAAALRDLRRTRGIAANPFKVFPRLIVSIDWLKRPRAMGLLREVLPPDKHRYPRRFDLLVIDEVHQCAPPGRGHYARSSQRTEAVQELAPHFEHRLFVSATPHNGYTESFTALLALLDPQRFAPGVMPRPDTLASVIVRRLKSDIKNPDGTLRFPERKIVALEVDYPDDEVQVHAQLNRYAELRRRATQSAGSKGTADLVTLLLKKRLFSSPAAFAATLEVHRETLERAPKTGGRPEVRDLFDRLDDDFDDEDEAWSAEEQALAAAAASLADLDTEETELLDAMSAWATANRGRPDAKAERLLDWVDETCRDDGLEGIRTWNTERVILFTEYRTTQLYIQQLLEARGLGGDRLALLYGGMDEDARERIKDEFQHHPRLRPVRILLATDAASEGIDLQHHCHRLVHVEIPFSPTRLDQRNGRIDRHGQPSPEVLIHHFVGTGWQHATPERWRGVARGTLEADLAFLSLIARKVETIRDDLGAVAPVLADQVEAAMLGRPADPDANPRSERRDAARALNRLGRDIERRITELRRQLDESIEELHLHPDNVERVTQTALSLANQPPLRPATLARPTGTYPVFEVPPLSRSWATTTTDLYDSVAEVTRPITFDNAVAAEHDDVVLAHLNHRLVAQAMRTLRAEIWSSGAERRMGRVSARLGGPGADDLGVVAYARLVLVGGDGRRLHEEVLTAGGRVRAGAYARWGVGETQAALAAASYTPADPAAEAQIAALWPRVADSVFSALEARAKGRVESLGNQLAERAESDVTTITSVLSELRRSIEAELRKVRGEDLGQLTFGWEKDERDQLDRNIEALERRIDEIPDEIQTETRAIRARYAAPVPRLFPAAVEFLVPTGWAR